MLKIGIIYHSGYGHTEKLAHHLKIGIDLADGVEAHLVTAKEASEQLDSLKDYDGMLFGAPTYMGSLSAEFKSFMEVSSSAWFVQDWKDKLAGGFTNSHSLAGDKQNALMQLFVFASQNGMNWVSLGLMNESAADDKQSGDEGLINRIGYSIGLVSQSENASPDITPPPGDIKSAELFGKRFADAVLRWNTNK